NANQLAGAYTLIYNKARQAAITNEILDIVGGAEALQASIDKVADEVLLRFQHDMLGQDATLAPRQRSKGSRQGGKDGGAQRSSDAASAPAAVMELEAEAPSEEDDLTVIEGI